MLLIGNCEHVIIKGNIGELERWINANALTKGDPQYKILSMENGVVDYNTSIITAHELKNNGEHCGFIQYSRIHRFPALIVSASAVKTFDGVSPAINDPYK